MVPVIAGLCSLISCKDNSTSPPPATKFSVTISAKDPIGTPVPGLRISVWNHLSVNPGKVITGSTAHRGSVLPISSIMYEVATSARVTLSVLEFDGTPVSTPVDDILLPGTHVANWEIPKRQPTRIYTYRLIAIDTATNLTLFRDSLYAVLFQPDAEMSILGWTSPAGEFETSDPLFFPNALDLPPLIHTLSTGPTPIDTFAIRDTVTIVLTDTTQHRQMTYTEVVRKGVPNSLELLWNPARAEQWSGPAFFKEEEPTALQTAQLKKGLLVWKLFQNFPNPFN